MKMSREGGHYNQATVLHHPKGSSTAVVVGGTVPKESDFNIGTTRGLLV